MTKILLVEDDKSLREIYGVRLLAEGYDIVSAGDGEEALAMAIKERPGLIVSDVMMPKISGFDMLDILRSTTETKDIKVIMMTALSSEDQRLRGEQLGADRYLVKSQVGIEDVVRTVHDVIGDVPSTAPTAQQTFGTPAPSAVARPITPPARPVQSQPSPSPAPVVAPTPVPTVSDTPQSQPISVQQATPTPAPTYQAPTPTPQPQAGPIPVESLSPQAQAQSQEPSQGLPQPTAPFSTPRPANLGERIIHPIEHTEPTQDFSNLISQELDTAPAGEAPFGQPTEIANATLAAPQPAPELPQDQAAIQIPVQQVASQPAQAQSAPTTPEQQPPQPPVQNPWTQPTPTQAPQQNQTTPPTA